MVGFYAFSGTTRAGIKRNWYEVSYGTCCQAITQFGSADGTLHVFIPVISVEAIDGITTTVTEDEVIEWVNFVNRCGVVCSYDEPVKLYTPFLASYGLDYFKVDIPIKSTYSMYYNLIAMSFMRYIYTTACQYRTIYLECLKLRKLFPKWASVTCLQVSHRTAVALSKAHPSNGVKEYYSSYYGLLPATAAARKMITSTKVNESITFAPNVNSSFLSEEMIDFKGDITEEFRKKLLTSSEKDAYMWVYKLLKPQKDG